MTMPFTPCEQNAGESCSDVSVGILTKIFGDAIPQLASGGDPSALTPASSVLASMMTSFNSGILVVAGLILAYIATVGVVNTANDGEAFGKNWSSVWTPVRVVSGFTALIGVPWKNRQICKVWLKDQTMISFHAHRHARNAVSHDPQVSLPSPPHQYFHHFS